jgi:cytochrome c oxidase cbb3-type subunit 4
VSTTYEFFSQIAQTWGLVYFVILFIIVLIYALWPSRARQRQFDEMARMPLRED